MFKLTYLFKFDLVTNNDHQKDHIYKGKNDYYVLEFLISNTILGYHRD